MAKSGLSVRTFGGLNEKRYTKGTGGSDRFKFEKSDKPYAAQFCGDISDPKFFLEFDQHQFQDKGWNYVPCLGEGCPLCEDEDKEVAKKRYRFIASVYSFSDKTLCILEGPKDLSGRIARKWKAAEKKKKGSFTKTVFDLTKVDSQPVGYEVDVNDDRKVVDIDVSKAPSLQEYLDSSARRFFGDGHPADSGKKKKKGKPKKSALDDEDEETQEDSFDADELEGMSLKDVKAIAKNLEIKLLDKEGEKRDQKTLIKLIMKKQNN